MFTDVRSERRWQHLGFLAGYACLGAVWIVVVGFMYLMRSTAGPALLFTIVLVGLALVRPTMSLGIVIVLGVLGDAVSMGWWPSTKNFSSVESILFVADAITIKPVDLVFVAITLALVTNRFLTPTSAPIRWGPLIRPLAAFTAAIGIGLVWGIARGGDLRAAYFESSPLLYIPVLYFLAVNFFTSVHHYRRLIVGIVAALTVESLYAIANLDKIRRFIGEGQSAFEHSAVIHYNLAVLLTVAVGWFGAKRQWPRPLLLLAMIPIGYLLLDGQRRAGIVALIIGGTLLAWILYTRDRQRFFRTIPVLVLVVIGYTAAFWNSGSQLAFPAEAVRSVIQPAAASESDSLSDLYRDFENLNLNATIRSNPVLGIGFGNKFLQPIPMPDIGMFFEFADYIPHNIILWIWAKTGILGFLSFFHMSGLAIALGVRAAVRLRDPVDVAVMSSFAAYVPMTIVVAFVDISIDPTTLMLFGLSLAAASTAEHLDRVQVDDPAISASVGGAASDAPRELSEVTTRPETAQGG